MLALMIERMTTATSGEKSMPERVRGMICAQRIEGPVR